MFERFTEDAIHTMILAQEEARAFGHDVVGTEQILLGLIALDKGIAATELKMAGVALHTARREVENLIGRGSGGTAQELPFTPNARKVLESSWHESKQLPRILGATYIGTGHLLLGLMIQKSSVAVQVLTALEVNLTLLRERVLTRITDTEMSFPSNPDFKNFQDDLATLNLASGKVLDRAQEEARRLGHNFVGTEQILLGLLGDDSSLAFCALASFGLNQDQVRAEIERLIGRGSGFVASEIPFTHRTRRILTTAARSARKMGRDSAGPEHLLLAVIDEAGGTAFKLFEAFNVDLVALRKNILDLISSS